MSYSHAMKGPLNARMEGLSASGSTVTNSSSSCSLSCVKLRQKYKSMRVLFFISCTTSSWSSTSALWLLQQLFEGSGVPGLVVRPKCTPKEHNAIATREDLISSMAAANA